MRKNENKGQISNTHRYSNNTERSHYKHTAKYSVRPSSETFWFAIYYYCTPKEKKNHQRLKQTPSGLQPQTEPYEQPQSDAIHVGLRQEHSVQIHILDLFFEIGF